MHKVSNLGLCASYLPAHAAIATSIVVSTAVARRIIASVRKRQPQKKALHDGKVAVKG